MSEKVGFVGLGIMGKPMARNIMQAGYELVVHNRTTEKAEKLASEGATAAGSPTASVINIDPVVSGKHVGIRSSLQEQTRSASTRRRSMPAQPTGSIIMNTAVGRWPKRAGSSSPCSPVRPRSKRS